MPIYPPLVMSINSRRCDNAVLRQPVDLGVRVAAIAQHAAGIGADRFAPRPADFTRCAVEMRSDAGDAHLAEIGIVESRDTRTCDDMRIAEELLDVIDRPGGDVAFMQNSKRLFLRMPDHPGGDDAIDLLRALRPQNIGRER